MKAFNHILSAITLCVVTGVASAVPIDGTIKFGGDLTFDFATNTVDILGDDAYVTADPTGSFSSISAGDTAIYNDFTYDPFAAVSPLWSIGDFSFSLNQITYIGEYTDLSGNQYLALAGEGIFSGTGFDDTAGTWTFSANDVFGQFAFSSVNTGDTVFTTASTIPEPGTALLLGVGLVGFGISRKLLKTA